MKIARSVIWISILLLVFTGCKTVKDTTTSNRQESSSSQKHDSIHESVKYVPVKVFVADSASIRAYLECDSAGQVLLKELVILRGRKIDPKIIIHDNMLYIPIAFEDSLTIYNMFSRRFESQQTNRHESSEIEETSDKVVYKTPFKSILISGAVGLVLGLIICIIIKIKFF